MKARKVKGQHSFLGCRKPVEHRRFIHGLLSSFHTSVRSIVIFVQYPHFLSGTLFIDSSRKPIDMKNSKTKASGNGAEEEISSKLGKLFEDGVRDIYWAEKALLKSLGKMAKNATSEDLIAALELHQTETEDQVLRLEKIFSLLGKSPRGKKCDGMEGLIKEGESMMDESDEGPMRDAAIIAAAQKAEHYEISSYGTLRTFAQTIGLNEAVSILEETLDEEKETDTKLSELAVSNVNLLAASQSGEE